MSTRNILVVARWEFFRYIKVRQQLVSFAVMIALGVGGGLAGRLVSKTRSKPVKVAVIGAERLGRALPVVARVAWTVSTSDEATLRAQVNAKATDGYIVVLSPDSLRVVLRDKATWPGRVRDAFSAARRERILAALNITPAALATLSSQTALTTDYTRRKRDSEAGDKAVAFGLLLLVFTGLITGVSYLFTGITGEKQLRVTESILSSISPAEWLDGKILGQLVVALIGIVNTVIVFTTLGVAARLAFPDAFARFTVPAVSPWLVLEVLVLVLLGMALWYVVLGAITSTIDDPNNSMRSTALLLPMLPLGLAWSMQDKADSVVATVLSLFPLTSYAVLPIRLAITSPAWWEFPVATMLLLVTITGLRRLGGKVFAVGVQMYGKEPSWREMWRAVMQ